MAAKTWIGWTLAVAGVVAAGPLVLGRGNPAFSAAHEEISRMSEVERLALDRKHQQYRALTEDQRNNLRKLHQQIEDDRTKGARYLTTMTDYCEWLKTIDAWQQNELAHIEDPQQKALKVVEIAKIRKLNSQADEASGEVQSPWGNGTFQIPQLTEEQLTKAFNVLAKRLTNLTEDEQKQLESLHGLKRFGVQVKFLKRSIPNPEMFFRSISDAELKEMIQESGNPELNAVLTGPGDAGMRKGLSIIAVFSSCRAQFTRESAALTDTELQTYFNTLPPDEKDQLLQLRADEFKTQLKLRRLEGDPDIAELRHLMGNQFSAARRRMEKLRGEGGFPGPNGRGGPPFDHPGAGEGRRPPFDGRRDGDRGGPFRGPFGSEPPPRPGEEGGRPPRDDERPPPEAPERGPERGEPPRRPE